MLEKARANRAQLKARAEAKAKGREAPYMIKS